MKLIEAFYNLFGGIEIRIIEHSGIYTVCCYCDTERVVFHKGKSLNKTMLKTFCALTDMQGLSEEEIKEYKAIFKTAAK